MTTRRKQQQEKPAPVRSDWVSIVGQVNWVFEAGGFPGAVSGPRRGLDKTLFFPVRDLR
jgi:hypothetical protein